MSRPSKCKTVCFVPGVTYFKPAGVPLRGLEENRLSMEELEAVRLRDIECLDQAACAIKMNISRPTFQRVLSSARKNITEALLSGKALRIQGGNYELAACRFRCREGGEPDPREADEQRSRACPVCRSARMTRSTSNVGHERIDQIAANRLHGELMEEKALKIAVVSDDGKTISQHFGRATEYVVISAEGDRITGKEVRMKVGHSQFAASEAHEQGCGCGVHGHQEGAEDKHNAMSGNVLDCKVLLAGGMGWGAYESLKSRNIEPVVTDVLDIEAAVKQYLQGKLPNLMQRLH
jgi:predicted DNA-binding protein (UPF0251 family)/predicted Fe-Mo cluster-binding NifX family protein